MFKEIKDEKAFDGILNQIIDNIQNGHLKAGDALPAERTMAETMGVSRPAVREVLRALELLGIIKTVPGGGNYIADDLDSWLIGPLSILFKLNNGYIRQTQQLRAALELEMAILAARKCTPLDAAELWRILSSIDKAEDEKTRGELDKEPHTQIAKIADNPMIYSVLAAADQLIENIGYQMIRRNWSMKTLADKADLPYETVKHLMAGKIGRPSFISILKIANALECSLDDLAGRNNPALEALRRLADHADGMYQIFAEVEHLLYPNFMMQRENNK